MSSLAGELFPQLTSEPKLKICLNIDLYLYLDFRLRLRLGYYELPLDINHMGNHLLW